MYAHYGRDDDFSHLQGKADTNGRVLLVRAGKISYAEKVGDILVERFSTNLISLKLSEVSLC